MLETTINEDAVKAFIQVCGNHASLLSGRRRLAEIVAGVDTRLHAECVQHKHMHVHVIHV